MGSLTMIGCSSAYRTAQTPDDVYFSEGKAAADVTSRKSADQPQEGYASYWEKQDDDMLRMKVSDREKWSQVDDIDYWQGYNNNYWTNYNSGWNSPWGMNSWNTWNNPYHMNNPWAWNRPMMGWNSGWGMGTGMGMGWNNWAFGYNSWYNSWSNPYSWNQPVIIINKYPVGRVSSTSRTSASLSPYTNYNYSRGDNSLKGRTNVNPGTSRSIWEAGPSVDRSGNSMYRSVNRSTNSSGSSSYDRPARTFDGGGSGSGGTRSSGGTSGGSSGGSSSGGSSRGGRGG